MNKYWTNLSHAQKSIIYCTIVAGVLFLVWIFISHSLTSKLDTAYKSQESRIITDTKGRIITISPNSKGVYDQFISNPDFEFTKFLLKREDKYFYYHFGLNPISTIRGIYYSIFTNESRGTSTITQQLVKILLGHEADRSLKNKLQELIYAQGLEFTKTKSQILTMYLNTASFGADTAGIKEASEYYFNSKPELLNHAQITRLLAALPAPVSRAIGSKDNEESSNQVTKNLSLAESSTEEALITPRSERGKYRQSPTVFELKSFAQECSNSCSLTIDDEVSRKIRDILSRSLESDSLATAKNGAIVVIDLKKNELVALIGSPDPSSLSDGSQLNMTLAPRAVGSTAKPFIYLEAFKKGARPYTRVIDREYKYQVAGSFDFFPKNYDGQFRGEVSLHEALSNSLNIPSVKTLEFVGLDEFYKFSQNELKLKTLQNIEDYELGIALGALEVDPLTWSYLFTSFPHGGKIEPVKVIKNGFKSTPLLKTPMAETPNSTGRAISGEAYVELINKILSDRDRSVDQFGAASSLNLPFKNYALKTGTSRDYHDSWTMGYTPDFLVGVWIGNHDNTAMKQVTGAVGAGRVWHEVMELMYTTEYNKNTPFNFKDIKEFNGDDGIEFGLNGDDYEQRKQIMKEDTLILSPHNLDHILLEPKTTIPLEASSPVQWFVNNESLSSESKTTFKPKAKGTYKITAQTPDGKKAEVTIFLD